MDGSRKGRSKLKQSAFSIDFGLSDDNSTPRRSNKTLIDRCQTMDNDDPSAKKNTSTSSATLKLMTAITTKQMSQIAMHKITMRQNSDYEISDFTNFLYKV